MRKSDFTNRPDLFGRSNYLIRELLALYEQSFHTAPDSMADLEAYWQTNAALVGERLGMPSENLPGNQAIVTNGDTFSLRDATLSAAVANNAASFSLPGSVALIEDGDTFSLLGGTFTAGVADGEAGWSLPGTSGIVSNGATFPVDGGEVTVSVSGNTVSMAFTPDDEGGDG